jgi:manganese-dependent inorganic pyrophosphatase
MPNKIYVIGHVNPDTDSIAYAMGYAWLLRARDGLDTVAARAGALNPQSAWVLKQLKLDPPVLLTDASPRFESVMQRLDSIRPEAQLGMAWTLASRTGGIAPVVDEDGKPYGIVNGFSLFKYFTEVLGPQPGDTTVREMMSAPCKEAANTSVSKYPANGQSAIFSTGFCAMKWRILGHRRKRTLLRHCTSARSSQPAAPQDDSRGPQRAKPGDPGARRG